MKEEDQLTLVEAAEAGLLAEVERLLRKEGADVNQVEVDDEDEDKDEDDDEGAKREGVATASIRRGTTALHWAALRGNMPMVELLLEAGADVAIPDEKGNTALHSALHRAAKTGRKEIVEAFLAAGASSEMVLQKDLHGRTPVDVALEGGHEELLPSMLAAGERRVQALRGQDRALKQQIVSLERDLRVARQREREREGGGMP